jgi:hypothetical protein
MIHCSSPGPHTDASTEEGVSFACARCAQHRGAREIKLAVFATLARLAAEARYIDGSPSVPFEF